MLFNGSYHGGVSDDGSLAVTGAKLLRAHIGGNDTVWYHGEQACNVSLAPDSTKRVLFLDFGGKTGREFVSKNYTPHEYILIADSTGKLVQAIPAPDGYTFDHTEWTNVPDLIVATLVNADGGHSRIVLVDTRDSSVLHLVEGNELWHPSLWVSPNRNRLPSDEYAADNLGIYMTETSSIGSRIMKVKMDLFWTNRAKAQIAITGSSRTFAGVDPALLTTTGNTEAFNYSYSGQDMAATEFLIANYYLPLEKLKTLVIALNLDRWSYTDEAFQTLYNEVPGYIYDERHDFWQNGVPSNMAEIVLDNITPEPNEYNFYCYHNGLYRSIMIGYGDTPEITFRNYDTKAAQFNQEKLLSIIDLANSYGVNVVGVIFPQSPRYISNGTWGRYGPSLEDAKILLNFVDSLARQKSNFYVLDEYKNGEQRLLHAGFRERRPSEFARCRKIDRSIGFPSAKNSAINFPASPKCEIFLFSQAFCKSCNYISFMKFRFVLGISVSLLLLTACGGTSDGSNLEVPDNMPPACREIDFVEQPDMRELCGVRTVRFKSYRNIAKERYLVNPKDAKIVQANGKTELRIPGNFPIELNGQIVQDIHFDQNTRLKKISNRYEYHEGYKNASHKRKDRIRAFKLTIPTDVGTEYEYCFRIPEKMGNERTRNQAMGNRLEEMSCEDFTFLASQKKK